MEQQLAASLAERQVAEFVDDDEIIAQQLLGQAAASAGGLLLLELVDQIDQIEESSSSPGADDRRGDSDAQMGFSGAGAADEDRIAFGVEEGAGGEFAYLPFIDRSIGEDELVEIFEDRELGSADAVADRAGLPVGAFGSDQAGDEWVEFIAPGKALSGDLVEAGAHAVEFEFTPWPRGSHDVYKFLFDLTDGGNWLVDVHASG